MTAKKLGRIWVDEKVKRKIKVGAAAQGVSMSDFVKHKVSDDKAENILSDFNNKKRKKRGGGFSFPL